MGSVLRKVQKWGREESQKQSGLIKEKRHLVRAQEPKIPMEGRMGSKLNAARQKEKRRLA